MQEFTNVDNNYNCATVMTANETSQLPQLHSSHHGNDDGTSGKKRKQRKQDHRESPHFRPQKPELSKFIIRVRVSEIIRRFKSETKKNLVRFHERKLNNVENGKIKPGVSNLTKRMTRYVIFPFIPNLTKNGFRYCIPSDILNLSHAEKSVKKAWLPS